MDLIQYVTESESERTQQPFMFCKYLIKGNKKKEKSLQILVLRRYIL